uniref:transposase n=1 Tax=Paenibacillus sp. IHBB 10380 TaxID=1566358 RepID=UPI001186412B|nr:transposase [Paenibacillus sp. IHBB 10380]
MKSTPESTVQRFHKDAIPAENERFNDRAWKQAKANGNLVLGVDDFAIKKGHKYNTGIHDLRGEMMLDLLFGRRLEDL